MRKLKRSVAHAKMRKEGVQKINKPRYDFQGRRTSSYFAENWRKYV